ncbi:MAG TPA: CpaF family protein [Mollicutes bacterium]|nr:CpaF family protein [Mollicutes bacterium]
MTKKKLVDIFDIKKQDAKMPVLSDYEVFKDKELLDKLRDRIIQNLIDNKIPNNKNLRQYINDEIDLVLEGYDLTNLERSHIFNLIDNEINGYGPITELLDDDNVTEIMVNGINEVYVEVDGRVVKDNSISFINEEHILRTIQKIVQPLGRTIDTAHPMVDARLKDGSRINAVVPPLSIKGPVLTIRKFKTNLQSVEDFIRNGTLTPYMARFLEAAVIGKLNIIISGGTGSGKTSILNVLSSFIGNDERIVTIEDAAELRLKQTHVVGLETRLTNYEGEGEVTIRDLVINSLRMRPDRIIVGEVRGEEAFDMLQAMNTGHDGSLTTLHANSPSDALNRLETMILMAGMDIPIKAIREYIKNAIDLIVHVERLNDGRRKITSICEITEIKNDTIQLKEIFAFNKKGLTSRGDVDGEFVLYTHIPKVYEKLKARGVNSIEDIFENIKK